MTEEQGSKEPTADNHNKSKIKTIFLIIFAFIYLCYFIVYISIMMFTVVVLMPLAVKHIFPPEPDIRPDVTTITTEARNIHTVEYKVTGTAKEARISYMDDKGGMVNEKSTLPFHVKIPSKFSDSQTVALEVTKIGRGTVTGSIIVDKKVLDPEFDETVFSDIDVSLCYGDQRVMSTMTKNEMWMLEAWRTCGTAKR